MICIINKDQDGEILGWIIATDTHDARRQAESAGITDLAAVLYRIDSPSSGKHELPTGHIMLVG